MHTKHVVILSFLMFAGLQLVAGCSRDATPVSTNPPRDTLLASRAACGADAPGGMVPVTYAGETLDLWPYLTPDGTTPEDPLNLIFVGAGATAMQIRAALLALDGDRTAYNFPPVYPFNATWSDAMGGVQAAYTDDAGWSGSVIQLQLGDYGPVRNHLRLYETGLPFGNSGTWTLGGAHFELNIPGTPEHQVLAWEFAEQLVIVDLMRTGLLQAAPTPTDLINDAPGYRTIPPSIYNGIPDALKGPLGLPLGPSNVPVPIPTNGRATVLRVGAGSFDSGDGGSESLTIQFQQVIPKPFCAAGPADYYVVSGPVELTKAVRIDESGRYAYRYQLSGQLIATPYGGGEPFGVRIHDIQNGFLGGGHASLNGIVQRIAPQDGGAELLKQWFDVSTEGRTAFSTQEHCLTP